MIIAHSDLKKYVHGALSCENQNGYCSFFRFTKEQRLIYDKERPDFHHKTLANSSIRIEFETDADCIDFDALAHRGSSRKYCFIDITSDDILLCHDGKIIGDDFEFLHFHCTLEEGTHKVKIYLPNLAYLSVGDILLENATLLQPVDHKRRILCYGDSITQGYDALYPSLSYANILSSMLDADIINQAIGGEIFRNNILEKLPGLFDSIIVAYGTNDWTLAKTKAEFDNAPILFFQKLKELYPNTKIFYISPIWRNIGEEDHVEEKPYPNFKEAIQCLEDSAKKNAGATVIHGYSLTPHYSDFYSDKYLHPNDLGFTIYAKNLYFELRKYI